MWADLSIMSHCSVLIMKYHINQSRNQTVVSSKRYAVSCCFIVLLSGRSVTNTMTKAYSR